MATFSSSLKSKLIYVFAINDEWHKDCVKIGEATLADDDGSNLLGNSEALQKAAHKRIQQYTKTAGVAYQLLYTEIAIFMRSGMIFTFNDKQVHYVLERSGVKKKTFDSVKGASEWYCCDLETVKKAIHAVKEGLDSIPRGEVTHTQNPIVFRPEQSDAIKKTRKQFRKGNQMLWNAKMRFGKTLSALQVVKEEQFHRTLILTHRPVVDEGWFEDFGKIFYDRKDYHYGSRNKGETFKSLEQLAAKGQNYVYFASMQDLRGSEQVGGKFDKNIDVFKTKWDFLIIDEAHEGTKTELGTNVIQELSKPETKVLQLSGTPFNLFDDYSENEIFTWDYVMEQRAKTEWDLLNPGQLNPYESLPAINIYTYDLGALMSEYAEDEKAFNFREFFRTRDDDSFIHEHDVDNFLNLLCKEDKDSLYPYANDKFRRIFRHTLWMVPGVAAARALSTKLKAHPVFGNFQIVNVAGNGDEDEENAEALKMVNEKIGPDPDQTFTITLSCGRLTTGVSIKPWTGVFMMAGSFSTSAANYMQTIFRVQTPFTCNGRMKTDCYAFDFAPDRTLRVLAEAAKVSAKAGKQTDEDRRILGDFLNFCPIISIEGSQMKPYDVNKMMSQLKKAQIEKVVRCGFEDGALYNDELLKLTEVELKDFDDLKGIIGKTKAMAKTGDIDVNRQGFTNEEYEEKEKLDKKKKKDLTDEERARLEELKAKSNQRKEAISILRGISIRMPLLIYGAEVKNEETEITIDNFASLIDDQSWEEFMPKGVTKEVFERFKKYYEPDIFREAGKRIREMARAADKFTIEERIERIAAIFNTFRNPDKETVLTPWRVVNMHMSDCLGGWTFYDEEFKDTLQVPRFVDQGQVTKKVFRTDSHILEINSKSGLYPLYVAYNVYRSRVEAARAKYGEVSHGFAMSLWDAAIEENILVVCKTPMARSITRRTLAGFRDVRVNAQYFKDLIQNITERPAFVVNTLKDGKHFWKINNNENMKFDAIVGNPPYQVMDGGGRGDSSKAIYNLFVYLAKKISPNYVSVIIPARWYSGGKGLDEFRDMMIHDTQISYLHDFVQSTDCFPSAQIKGGICYFLWNKGYNGECKVDSSCNDKKSSCNRYLVEQDGDVFVRFNEAISALRKVLSKKEPSFATLISNNDPFGFDTREEHSARRVRLDFSLTPKKNDVLIYYYQWQTKGIGHVSLEEIKQGVALINCHKLLISKAYGAGDNYPHQIINNPFYVAPMSCCTETYLVIGPFDSETIAKNALSYMKTKFFRFLVLLIKNTQNAMSGVYRYAPLQDFTRPWTDADLYAKYGLTDEEIQFIESMIKPME
ncbi:MAG: Eco57I restriction-modification methylase domain-containing protein [Prevotella sp.]|nr:Eco57I restriction-modification methylase domain-containing protein [Prevotella sp.]